jgi:fructose-bisphosphate aldolase, class II
MLVPASGLLKAARKGGYAIGAFNVNNLEMLHSVITACVEERSPVIIQTTEKAVDYAGMDYLSEMIRIASREKIPVVMHLDHGKNIEIIKSAIKHGYTSVMFDGSKLPFGKNVEITRKVVKLARPKKISVEAELGVISGSEDYASSKDRNFTDPETARVFAEKTGVDMLAVSIGTKHGLSRKEIGKGMRKGRMHIHYDVLREISKRVSIPLVLHGASDLPAGDLRKCIRLGISKVNIDTELRVAFTKAESDFIGKNKQVYDPRKIMTPAIIAMKKIVKKKVRDIGSAGKA